MSSLFSSHSAVLSKQEQAELLAMQAKIHELLVTACDLVPASMWTVRSSPDTWSPAEIIEHVTLAEAALLARVRARFADPLSEGWASISDQQRRTLSALLPAAGTAKSPETLATFVGIAKREVRPRLLQSRVTMQSTLKESQSVPLKAILWRHSVFGLLSAHHWLLYIPLHSLRHVRQLQRQKAGYA